MAKDDPPLIVAARQIEEFRRELEAAEMARDEATRKVQEARDQLRAAQLRAAEAIGLRVTTRGTAAGVVGKRRCGVCGEHGHRKTNCSKRPAPPVEEDSDPGERTSPPGRQSAPAKPTPLVGDRRAEAIAAHMARKRQGG